MSDRKKLKTVSSISANAEVADPEVRAYTNTSA
jgi:hypothetical protein